jgi:hypothetical protein
MKMLGPMVVLLFYVHVQLWSGWDAMEYAEVVENSPPRHVHGTHPELPLFH